jgi:hypothetical protein
MQVNAFGICARINLHQHCRDRSVTNCGAGEDPSPCPIAPNMHHRQGTSVGSVLSLDEVQSIRVWPTKAGILLDAIDKFIVHEAFF